MRRRREQAKPAPTMKTQVDVKFYRPFRELKNGGCVASDMKIGVTEAGAVFVPANALGISDGDALRNGPVVIFEDTVFVELDEAIRIIPEPAAQRCLRVLKLGLLRKLR
jgi:hypothetical protein